MTARRLHRAVALTLWCLLLSLASGPSTPGLAEDSSEQDPELVASAPPPARPYDAGERLTYGLFWLNMQAGTATMQVTEAAPVEGRPTLKLFTIARSSDLVSAFYPVNNEVESVIALDNIAPVHTVFHRREGRRKNDFDFTFSHEDGTVRSIKDGAADVRSIPPGTHDILSCLYYIRGLPSLVPGTSVFLNVYHDLKTYKLEVRIEGRERIRTPWGEEDTVRVLALMPFQGLFLNEGNIRVWLTDDVRRLPVAMKAKVLIGSVTARLLAVNSAAR